MSKELFQDDLFSDTYDNLADVINADGIEDTSTQVIEQTEDVIVETSETSTLNEITNEEDSTSDEVDETVQDDKASPLLPYARMLVEDGILSHFDIDTFDGTPEGLKKAVQDEIIAERSAYVESLDPRIKLLVESLEAGVPFESLLKLDKSMIELSQIDSTKLAEDTTLQRDIAFKYFKKTTKFTDDKISKLVQKLEDLGDLSTDAEGYLSELKELESQEYELSLSQAEANRVKQEEARIQAITKLQEGLNKTTEFIPGVAINDKIRERVFKTLTTPVAQDSNGNPINKVTLTAMQDPDFNVKLTYLFEITDGFKKFDALLSPGKKRAISELEQAAARLDVSKGGVKTQKITDKALIANLDNLL